MREGDVLMSRVHSASRAKEDGKSRIQNSVPRPGTILRELWDLLHVYRAESVEISSKRFNGGNLMLLRDFYGLDIRKVTKGRPPKYMLVGEWIGSRYVDYVAERIERFERKRVR